MTAADRSGERWVALRIGGVVRGRRFWALLAVAAVVSMHGLQCISGPVGSSHATMAPAVPLPVLDGDTPTLVDAAGQGAHLGAAATSTSHLDAQDVPGHGMDLWTICLAGVVAALALVSVATLYRRWAVFLIRGPPHSMRGLRQLYRLRPPPDLSALCLLRI